MIVEKKGQLRFCVFTVSKIVVYGRKLYKDIENIKVTNMYMNIHIPNKGKNI